MYFDDYVLVPNVGIKDIKIVKKFEDVNTILKKENINFEIKDHEFENTDDAKWIYIIKIIWHFILQMMFYGKLIQREILKVN